MESNVVVMGGGYAGVLAALRMGRRVKLTGGRVVLLNSSATMVERIRLHEVASGRTPKPLPLQKWLARAHVELRVGRIQGIDRKQQRVEYLDDSGIRHAVAYTHVLNTTGSMTDVMRVPGVSKHAFTLDGDGPTRLAAHLQATPGALVVVGSGHTGIEAVTELAERHPTRDITLLSSGRWADTLSIAAAQHVGRALQRLKVRVLENVRVTRVDAQSLTLDDGRTLPCQACVWCAGLVSHALAADAGLPVNGRGQMLVDATLRSVEDPRVLAAGDCAALVTAEAAFPLGCKSAMPMGAHAADVLMATLDGRTPAPFRLITTGYCVSLGRGDAVIDLTRADATPRGATLRSRSAVFTKEAVCRYTVWSMAWESLWPGAYHWPHGARAATGAVAQLPTG